MTHVFCAVCNVQREVTTDEDVAAFWAEHADCAVFAELVSDVDRAEP